MNQSIQQAIFATNAFASEFPAEHVALWADFLKEVPSKSRVGYHGADNVAYIRWMKERKDPVFMNWAQKHIELHTG